MTEQRLAAGAAVDPHPARCESMGIVVAAGATMVLAHWISFLPEYRHRCSLSVAEEQQHDHNKKEGG